MSIQIASGQIQDSAVTNDKLAGSISSAKLDLTGTFNFGSGVLRAASPSGDSDVAIKSYVDAVAGGGVYWKEPVRVATTANVDLTQDLQNGDQIDGVTLATGDRVLVKDQSSQSANGIYIVVASGSASRSSDCDTADELNGAAVFVKEGSTNADQGFIQTAEIATLGTDNVVFVQFTGLGQITAGEGLTKTGNTLDVNIDDASIEIASDSLRVKAGGITNAMLAGSIANAKLANSTISGVALGNNLASLAAASNGGVTFTSYNGSAGVSDLKLDITDLADGVLDLAADFIAFADATDGVSKTESVADFISAMAGAGLGQNTSSKALEISVDDSSIEIASDSIQVKASGITNAMLAGSIANAKLANSTISGVALGANLFSLSKATNSGLAMTSFNGSAAVSDLALDVMDLVEESASTDDYLVLGASEGTYRESVPDFVDLIAGDGLQQVSGELELKIDSSTFEFNSSTKALEISPSAITNQQLAGSIATAKLLIKSVWKELSPDGSTSQFDLDEALSANLTSIQVFRNGLCMKQVASNPSGVDQYTVSATGGAGGVGRITFGANVGNSDDLRVFYIA